MTKTIKTIGQVDCSQLCGHALMIVPMFTPMSKTPNSDDGYLLACALGSKKVLKAIHKTQNQVSFIENNFIELWTFIALITDKEDKVYAVMALAKVTSLTERE